MSHPTVTPFHALRLDDPPFHLYASMRATLLMGIDHLSVNVAQGLVRLRYRPPVDPYAGGGSGLVDSTRMSSP